MSRVLSGKLRKAGRRVGPVSSLGCLDAPAVLPTRLGRQPRLETEGAFRSTKISGLKFQKFHMPNGTVPSGCTDPTQATTRLVIFISMIQNKRYWDNNFVKWKGTFWSDLPNGQTGQSWPLSKYRIFPLDQTEMVRSIWCTNQSFRNFGSNRKRPEPRRRAVQIKLTLVLISKARYQNITSFIPGKFPGNMGTSYKGGSRIFFRRGCTRLLLYFNTNKPHSFFFFFAE